MTTQQQIDASKAEIQKLKESIHSQKNELNKIITEKKQKIYSDKSEINKLKEKISVLSEKLKIEKSISEEIVSE